MGTPYDKKDATKETNVTVKEVSKAWHEARNDAAKEGGWGVPPNRHGDDKSSNPNNSSNNSSSSKK